MSKKSEFIKFVEYHLFNNLETEDIPNDVLLYWNAFKQETEVEKPLFTDNGKLILKYLQEHQEEDSWKARDIAEGLFMTSKRVSGAMRKLVTDGYIEKLGQDPVVYGLTETGKNIVFED